MQSNDSEQQSKKHWENVYVTKTADSVSWFQRHADTSLKLIDAMGVPHSAAVIDVGGGASTLADDLLSKGYDDLSVLDISGAALEVSKARLGEKAEKIRWIEGDITNVSLPANTYDVWHDRAVFHFLTTEANRSAYINVLRRSVKPGGHVLIATFAEDGPEKCSGLDVVRYSVEELSAVFSEFLILKSALKENHSTPAGNVQRFIYCSFVKK